jgi:hypothetical protein
VKINLGDMMDEDCILLSPEGMENASCDLCMGQATWVTSISDLYYCDDCIPLVIAFEPENRKPN